MSSTGVEEKVAKMEEQQQKTLANIKELQDMEKQLYSRLEAKNASGKTNLDRDLKVVDRINKLSNMRTDLYNQMGQTYSALTKNVVSNRNDLVNQTALTKLVEEELNRSKKSLQKRDDAKYNKLRMIEINTYEAKRLNLTKKVMQVIVGLCIALILLTFLYNRKLVSGDISKYIFVLLVVGTLIYLGTIVSDINKRDNMNFDRYKFDFDPEATKARLDAQNAANKNGNMGGCVNNNCCSDGTTWSKENSKCMSSDSGAVPTGPTSGSSTTGQAEGFQTSGHVQYQSVNGSKDGFNNELKKAGMLGMF